MKNLILFSVALLPILSRTARTEVRIVPGTWYEGAWCTGRILFTQAKIRVAGNAVDYTAGHCAGQRNVRAQSSMIEDQCSMMNYFMSEEFCTPSGDVN